MVVEQVHNDSLKKLNGRIASNDLIMVHTNGGKRKNFAEMNNSDVEYKTSGKKLKLNDDNKAKVNVPMLTRINSLESISPTKLRSTIDCKSTDRVQ